MAHLRSVFQTHDVERKLAKLPDRDHEHLRTTYERMLERGPDRFQVKPSGVPDMASLYAQLPNFTEVLDDVRRHVALAQDSRDGLEVTPMLLLGPPGIGKTHFAKKLAELLGTGMSLVPMSSMTAGWLLSGASSQWKGSKPGKVFEALVDGQYANPVMVVDEIDKAGADSQYDPLGALYNLLEHDTAHAFVDEFAEVPIDASQVIWITTANDARGIPEPILNRMNVFEIEAPSPEAARADRAAALRVDPRRPRLGPPGWSPEPSDDVLDHLADRWRRARCAARSMTGFGNARLAAPRRGAGRRPPARRGRPQPHRLRPVTEASRRGARRGTIGGLHATAP